MIDPAKPFDLSFTVGRGYDGERLDRFVRQMVPTISRTRIRQYNDEGRILVNGLSRAQNWKVRRGDAVTLQCREPEGAAELAQSIPVEVVYEDEALLAVNKQPGLVVHPVALHRHDTLMNALYHRYKDRLGPGTELSLVNRIDKLTSGVVLVSKTPAAKRILQQQFESRVPYKTYLALATGRVEAEQGEIDAPIGPKERSENRCLMDIRRDGAGKPSQTRFWALERFPGATLVRVAPRTGRQHQIRVHLRLLGHPLVGDHLYGDAAGRRWQEAGGETRLLERFALHAESLTIRHPVTDAELRLEAPLAPDLAGLLDALRRGAPVESFPLGEDREEEEETE